MTGELSWAWDMGRPDEPGLPPNGESYTVATPNSWAPAVADEQLGLVYLPTGSGALGITMPWEIPMGTPTHGGGLVVAGGIGFHAGAKDSIMRAFNLATGEIVWQHELPAAGGAPISYTVDGEQYIVVVAGGQGAIQSRYSTKVVAFKLPS